MWTAEIKHVTVSHHLTSIQDKTTSVEFLLVMQLLKTVEKRGNMVVPVHSFAY